MEKYYLAQTIAVSIASAVALVTLVLGIIKELKHSKSIPFRTWTEYEDEFSDIVANYGLGSMEITDFEIWLDGEKTDYDALYKLYEKELKVEAESLVWDDYIDNKEVLNRITAPKEQFEIVKIDPTDEENLNVMRKVDSKIDEDSFLELLLAIRKRITLKIKYKEIYSATKKELTLK